MKKSSKKKSTKKSAGVSLKKYPTPNRFSNHRLSGQKRPGPHRGGFNPAQFKTQHKG
jgi:hypothetical protein